MHSIFQASTKTELVRVGYAERPLSEQQQLALSFPDLLAGTMANGLPRPLLEGNLPVARDAHSARLTEAAEGLVPMTMIPDPP